MNGFLASQKINTAANDFFAAVNLTRSAAIQRAERVDLIPAGERGNWSDGWLVLVDRNLNQKWDNGEPLIFTHGAVSRGMVIQSRFTDNKAAYIAYTAFGRTRTNANSQTPQTGSWTFTFHNQARKIIVNFLGRVRMCNPVSDLTNC